MNVQPTASFEAVIDTGTPGLLGSVGVEVNDNIGLVVISYTLASSEIAPGVYSVVLTAPSALGQFSLIWRQGAGGTVLGVEDLVITGIPPVFVGPPPSSPPSVGGLTFKQLQDECVNFRFGENRRASVKLWINRRMQAVWGEAEWPFKRVNRQPVTFSSGQLVMPVGFRRAIALEDMSGGILTYRDPELFRSDNPSGTSGGETASEYTVWGGQILLDVGVEEGTQFLLSYQRRIIVRGADGLPVEGLLTADTESPWWDPEFHYMLVLGATSTGLKLENDFTWNALEDEFQSALMEMKEDLLPPDTVGTSQYGADDLA